MINQNLGSTWSSKDRSLWKMDGSVMEGGFVTEEMPANIGQAVKSSSSLSGRYSIHRWREWIHIIAMA